MFNATFKGGIHPNDKKYMTRDEKIIRIEASKIMRYPLSQHIGAPCEPLVKAGDKVLVGQKIADSKAFVSAPIHSSVSGFVIGIEKTLHPNGNVMDAIVIENDFKYKKLKQPSIDKKFHRLSKEDKLAVIREAGIVGLGGACFPTHIKMNPPCDIDCLIVNGAECEPYLTNDFRLMLENTSEIIEGIKYMLDILSCNKAYIAIEENKPEAIKVIEEAVSKTDRISVVSLKTKYPQGSEKHLIYAVTGKEVPSGGLPSDVGVVVDNVDTCISVYKACKFREPLTERTITVSGECIEKPTNCVVRIGTSISDIIAAAGGIKGEPKKILMGGPMMGMCLYDTNVPSVKGTSAVLLLSESEIGTRETSPCIRCAKCVQKCPMQLMPLTLNMYAMKKDLEMCEKYNIMDCIECGVCTYLCQTGQNVVQNIKEAKRLIRMQKARK